jgi:integrase
LSLEDFNYLPKATSLVVGQVVGLTSLEIKNAPAGMHADGNGLYLCVKPSGSKSWIFRYQLNGRRREMGLGCLDYLEPVRARAEAASLKSKLSAGVDPLDERAALEEAAAIQRKSEQARQKKEAATFEAVAAQYIDNHRPSWQNVKHAQQWENTLRTYAYPIVGHMPVGEITTEHVVAILKPIWSTKSETASRVRMRIEAVLTAAKLLGLRSGDNPAIFKGGLEAILPPISKVRKVRHHPALPFEDAPQFMSQLRNRTSISAKALEFCILTAARSGEVRHATWEQIDHETGLWTVPAERMKARREHRVPLSKRAIEVLGSIGPHEGSPLMFPGNGLKPLSDMTLSAVLKRMDLSHFTVHGFRSTFRDWAAETTPYPNEVVEMALAHTIANKSEAAYRRGDLLQKRRQLMDDWAAFLERP